MLQNFYQELDSDLMQISFYQIFSVKATAVSLIPGPKKKKNTIFLSECKMHFTECNSATIRDPHTHKSFNWKKEKKDWTSKWSVPVKTRLLP